MSVEGRGLAGFAASQLRLTLTANGGLAGEADMVEEEYLMLEGDDEEE